MIEKESDLSMESDGISWCQSSDVGEGHLTFVVAIAQFRCVFKLALLRAPWCL